MGQRREGVSDVYLSIGKNPEVVGVGVKGEYAFLFYSTFM